MKVQLGQLLQKYREQGVVAGRRLLLPHHEALCLIDDCEKLGFVIIGIDFFKVIDGKHLFVNSTAWPSWGKTRSASAESVLVSRRLIGKGLPDGATHVFIDMKSR